MACTQKSLWRTLSLFSHLLLDQVLRGVSHSVDQYWTPFTAQSLLLAVKMVSSGLIRFQNLWDEVHQQEALAAPRHGLEFAVVSHPRSSLPRATVVCRYSIRLVLLQLIPQLGLVPLDSLIFGHHFATNLPPTASS